MSCRGVIRRRRGELDETTTTPPPPPPIPSRALQDNVEHTSGGDASVDNTGSILLHLARLTGSLFFLLSLLIMAEALAMVGLASALVQFIEFGGKVLRQLRRLEADISGMPAVFQNVRSRLPLMVDLVKKIMLRMDAGLVDENSQEMILPVVRNCAMQAEQLDELISRALPQKNESTWSRGKKAVIGVLAEAEIERIDAAFKANFNLLTQANAFQMMDNGDGGRRGGVTNGMFNFMGSNVQVTVQGGGVGGGWGDRRGTGAMDELFPKFGGAPPAYQSPPYGGRASPPFSRRPSSPFSQSSQSQRPSSPAPAPAPAPPAMPSVFMVPFPRDPNFLGRRTTINQIDQRLASQPAVSLAGLGGIG